MSIITKLVSVVFAFGLPLAAHAEVLGPRVGEASYFVNDFFGDGHDRWRSGSYTKSFVYQTDLSFGDEIELRGRAEIISPWGAGIQTPNRAYSGVLGFGAFMHASPGGVDLKYGGEVIATGNKTGLDKLQSAIHDVIGHDGYTPGRPGEEVLCDCFYGSVMAEAAYDIRLAGSVNVRPFAEVQAGYEDFARAGVDVYLGILGGATDFTRDPVTGFSVPYKQDGVGSGLGVVVGYDYTFVDDTVLLGDTVTLEKERYRIRAGLLASFGHTQVFGGMAKLSKEFSEQVEDQVVGVLSLNIIY